MPGCKAPEILRSEAYLNVRRNDEGPAEGRGNAADGRFSTACKELEPFVEMNLLSENWSTRELNISNRSSFLP
jgi:hypothetical protein